MSAQKRLLDFHNSTQVVDEISRLRNQPYQKLGKWNLTQICEHLSKTMAGGMDPAAKPLPWIVRKWITEPMVRSWIKNRAMKPNGMTSPALLPTPNLTLDDPAKIDACLQLVHQVEAFQGSLENLPLGKMSLEDWKQLQWIHASHHLGYLIPQS